MKILHDKAVLRQRPYANQRRDTQSDWFEAYRQDRGRFSRPRELTKNDRLQVMRRYTRSWP